MQVNDRAYRSDYDSDEAFLEQQRAMNDYCIENSLCLNGGEDDKGYYLVIDAPAVKTFEDLKNDKLTELETSFDRKVSGSFTCSLGYPMQFNRSDALAVQGAVMLMEASGAETGYLTDAQDVTHYNVPLADIKTVLLEMLGEYARCHALKQTYRAQVNACETEEALNAVEFTWESY